MLVHVLISAARTLMGLMNFNESKKNNEENKLFNFIIFITKIISEENCTKIPDKDWRKTAVLNVISNKRRLHFSTLQVTDSGLTQQIRTF